MKSVLSLAICAALSASAAAQDNDPDRFKVSTALLIEGQKQIEKKNVPVALAKLKKAADKAKEEKNAKVLAEALDLTARINENLDPENIDAAKAAWEGIVADASDVQPYADRAKEKLANKGVDVWLTQLGRQLDAWRISADRSPAALLEKKKVVSDKILALNQDAVPGLIWGLSFKDDVVRDFAADTIAEVIDEPGIAALIAKLNSDDASARSGASAALQRVYRKANDAAELDRRASELELQLNTVAVQEGSRAKAHHDRLKGEVTNLQGAAGKIRGKIPASLDTPGIQGALEKIIGDENALPQARRDAAVAAAWIGNISGPLVDALIKGMESKDRNVREACCRAAGAVNTALSADKHKLADVLIKNLQYEPAKDENKAEAAWANDEAVRQACAEALSRIALVKSLPALIEALDDNDARVRKSAYDALSAVTRRDLEASKDEKTNLPKTYEPDAPLKDRREAQAKWKEWWESTKGVVVLVERFHAFQAGWRDLSVIKLFEPASFLKEIDSRKWVFADPKAVMDRAERVVKDFQAKKDVFVQDAVDLGPEAVEKLLTFIGGETEREAKPSPGTRHFVAEAIAKSIEKNGGDVAKVSGILGSGEPPKKVGAAVCLGFLPKDKVGGPERAALQDQGLADGDPEVREAAAVSLGKVGEEGSAAALTKAATDAVVAVQVAALRSLTALAPKNPDTVKVLGELVADEPDVPGGASKKSQNAGVREGAVDALGAIADPASIQHLLRARRDNQRQVYEAARVAIPKVYAAGKDAAREELLKVLKDERRKTDDRGGAALTIGDSGDVDAGKAMSDQLVDLNPPRVLRDQDAEVRMRICAGLGNLKAKNKTIVERLLQCMGNEEDEREAVRNAAYRALAQIFDLNPGDPSSPDKDKKFDGSDPKAQRSAAIQAWTTYVNAQNLAP